MVLKRAFADPEGRRDGRKPETCATDALAQHFAAVSIQKNQPPQTTGSGQASTTPPPSAAANAYLDAVRRGDLPAIEQAIAGGVDVDTPFRYDRRALSFAADRGQADVVRLLLAKGAKVDLEDAYYHQTALGWASSPAQTRKPDHAQVVKLLLEKGAKGADRVVAAAIDADDLAMLQVPGYEAGDVVVIVAGAPPNTSGSTNLIRVHRLGHAD